MSAWRRPGVFTSWREALPCVVAVAAFWALVVFLLTLS